jgi:hypothetical protein
MVSLRNSTSQYNERPECQGTDTCNLVLSKFS